MNKLRNDPVELTVADIETAELNITHMVQRDTYGAIHCELSTDAQKYKQVVNKMKNSLIKQELHGLCNLCPFFDSDGILRVKGRLSKINISYNRHHQMILPK